MLVWRYYTIIWVGTYSAAIDVAEINNASGKLSCIVDIDITQKTEFGDAEDEQVECQLIKAHSTSGSGGSAFTPLTTPGDAAYSGTVEIGNTTLATGGSPVTRSDKSFNVRQGFPERPTERVGSQMLIASGERAVVRLPNTPTDAMTVTATIVIAEAG
jgi:hypothetical protein